jgi:uncharacterized protein YyaL (SSP411 family)
MMGALYSHRELVCATKEGIQAQLLTFLKDHPAEDLQVILKTERNQQVLSQAAPFTSDYPIPEKGVMYYLCENGACKAPVADFLKLNL